MGKKEEKSQLLEKVEEVTESKEEKFDPSAFTDEIIKTKEETKPVDKSDEKEEKESEEDMTWDSIEVDDDTEEESEDSTEEDEDWDAAEEEEPCDGEDCDEEEDTSSKESSQELDWGKISKELGVKASTKDDLINSINSLIEETKDPGPQTDSMKVLNDLISLNDRELLGEEMKADGMDEYDVDEALDKMEDSGVLKREAVRIRKQLKRAVKSEKENLTKTAKQEEEERSKNLAQNKKDLQDHLKGVDSYFGGKVSKNEKKNLYKYIISGKFNDDIYNSHSNVSEMAWMWRNKEKIKKILFSEGFEKGKAHIFNGITSPSTNRSSKPNLKIKTGEFDAGEFMKE